MKKFIFMVILLAAIEPTLSAQEIATDNKGEPIFTIPSSDVVNTEFALKNLGLTFRPIHFKKKQYYVMNGGSQYYTMHKSTVLNIGGSLVDNNDDVFTLSKDAKITPHVEIGISRGIDKLINPSKTSHYYTLSGSLFADFQQFNLYDTVNKVFLPKKHYTSYGAKMGFNIFYKTKYAVSFNLSYKKSIEADNHISYQEYASGTTYVDNNISINGDDDGYISPLNPSKNWRMSLSVPWFFTRNRPLAIIPYYFITASDGFKPKNNAGILLSVLNDKFRNFDQNNTGSVASDQTYSFKSAFSVGLNFISTGTKNQPFIFLSGTITLGSSRKTANIEQQPNKLLWL